MGEVQLPPDISLSLVDVAFVVLYFLVIFGTSWAVSRRGDAGESATSYFSADKEVTWIGVSLSLFASNIGSEHFVGLAGTAAFSGFTIGWFEIGAVPCLFVLAFIALPVYLNAKVATVSSITSGDMR